MAALLSFVAGIVAVTGLLSIKILSTNLTGHFAHFSEDIGTKTYFIALLYCAWILSFLSGSFFSNTIVELIGRKNAKYPYTVVLFIEAFLIFLVGFWCRIANPLVYKNMLACILLFSMGMQNSMVTKVSNAIVRTTHVTGLFTDLGIELSQLFFYTASSERKALMKNIKIRLVTILFFSSGCIIAGFTFPFLTINLYFIAGILVIYTSFYERVRINTLIFLRHHGFRRHTS
ncbi:MAG TPA: YoaK family protein [Bacteroidia bacterium]|nr:YoaK family protein [Bacteroidia bacterium]